jgi:hypothetical protein
MTRLFHRNYETMALSLLPSIINFSERRGKKPGIEGVLGLTIKFFEWLKLTLHGDLQQFDILAVQLQLD